MDPTIQVHTQTTPEGNAQDRRLLVWHGDNSNTRITNNEKQMKTLRTQIKAGFTLVEVMIVAVIIGLLAAMAIPAWQQVELQQKYGHLVGKWYVIDDTEYIMKNPERNGSGGVTFVYQDKHGTTINWKHPDELGGGERDKRKYLD